MPSPGRSPRLPLLAAALAVTALCATPASAQRPDRATLAARLDSLVTATIRATPVAGLSVAVVRGRDTLLLKGYGSADLEHDVPATPATVHRIGSVTKQFTSAAIMKLVEEGKLALDDTLGALLPEVPAHWRPIRLRHLLDHTSGIPSYTDVARMRPYFVAGLPYDTLVARLRGDSLLFEPGTAFYYNNTGYSLLGRIIEVKSGRRYGEYLAERFFGPLGLQGTLYCSEAPIVKGRARGYARAGGNFVNAPYIEMDVPHAAGSLCSTVGDLVAWTRALAGGRVVSAESYRAMTSPAALAGPRRNVYGFGLSVDTLGPHRVVQHGGAINGFISHLLHVPGDSLVVVVLANSIPGPSSELALNLARVVLGLPVATGPAPLRDEPTSDAERARYVGRYAVVMPDGSRTTATVRDDGTGKLVLQLEGQQQQFQLQRQSEHVFASPAFAGGRILFDVQGGRAVAVVIDRGARPLVGRRID